MGGVESKNGSMSNRTIRTVPNWIASLTQEYENYLNEMGCFNGNQSKVDASKKALKLSDFRKTLQTFYKEESNRLNRLATNCGLPQFREEENVFDAVQRLTRALEKANQEKEKLEETNVALTAQIPIDPEEVHKIYKKMVESLKSFNKDGMKKKLCQNYEELLKSNPSLKVVEEAVQKISEFDRQANVFEYVLTTNVKKIEESTYISPSDLLVVPEQPKYEDFHFESPQVELNQGECSICLIEVGNNVEDLSCCPTCNQKFHKQCVGDWLKQCAACPLCRNPYELLRWHLDNQNC